MILMPIIMVSPVAALALFYLFSLETALPIYVTTLIVAVYCYYVMFKSMRDRPKTGLEAMIGSQARVIEDIDPQGRIAFKDEIWTAAAARSAKIAEGEKVRILGIEGMVLIVEVMDENKKRSIP